MLFEGLFIFQLTGDSVQTPPNKYRCPNKNKTEQIHKAKQNRTKQIHKTKQNRAEQIHKTKHQLDFLTSI